MTMLTRLQPSRLWNFFAQICQIPHPSKQEAALRDWITDLAMTRDLAVSQDSKGNLLIRKPASAGMEQVQPVILQAHLDMVPQANADRAHDFSCDPIQPYIEGDWVRAKGTTLGADNGIGVAACLAVLTDPTVKHGPLEVLFTVDEEAGMGGAFALQPDWLEGKILINTDAEQDGDIYMGCAGGLEARLDFTLDFAALPEGYQTYRLQLGGLQGGHSGLDIHEERGNANQLLCRTLFRLQQHFPLKISALNGGTLRNAIPREACAVVALPPGQQAEFIASCHAAAELLRQEYQHTDPAIQLTCTPCPPVEQALTDTTQSNLLAGLTAIPNGVIRMSHAITGVVETSTNLGVIRTEEKQLSAVSFVRSLTDEGRAHLHSVFAAVAALSHAEAVFSGDYSGWAPDPDSAAMQIVQQQHQRLFGQQANIMVIHAGLECGLFKKTYPHLDMVSIGPTIKGAHSPDERVSVSSVERFWQLLTATLAAIPQQ
ncbi:aminoacyl-histidine dipeptidase [Tolumonas osonensis]|nr:aminoacyl-histidine dipeptidase [Tolumonas osonensis]